ncbi:MAG: type II toxin-antitoxin system Phd/YefM family antitoxin [Actinomycetota bacterium]
MERVGVRELRQNASEILRRVEAGESFEVTDRGRPVALLVKIRRSGLAKLEAEGRLRRGTGNLLDLPRVPLAPGELLPSERVSEGRDE